MSSNKGSRNSPNFTITPHDSLLHIHTTQGKESSSKEPVKLAMFDLDKTLIEPKTQNIFSKNPSDWKFTFDNVEEKLREFAAKGYHIVILSNQRGIGCGLYPKNKFMEKLGLVLANLDLRIVFLAALHRDEYRKPFTGMWTYLTEKVFANRSVDMKSSFYCGDSAGRPNNIDKCVIADHSSCDILFAQNVGIEFRTPERVFNNCKKKVDLCRTKHPVKKIGMKKDDFFNFYFKNKNDFLLADKLRIELKYPKLAEIKNHANKPKLEKGTENTIILLNGPPSSGKNHFIYSFFKDHTVYNWQNYKSIAYLLSELKREMQTKARSTFIVKEIAGTVEKRNYYLHFANKMNARIILIHLDFDREVCLHLNDLR